MRRKDFYAPETASSSGGSHVPSEPLSSPSLREKISRDSCLQLDTRNSLSTSGNVFESLHAQGGPSLTLENSKNLASPSCGFCPIGTGKIAEPGEGEGCEPSTCQGCYDLESQISCRRKLQGGRLLDPEISTFFFAAFRASGFQFSFICRVKWCSKLGSKNNKFRAPF